MAHHHANKVALITGGASGIGEATAIKFANEGAKVVISDIQEEKGKQLVDRVKQKGGDAIFIKADVSKEEDVRALVKSIVEHYGRLDYAFNNAGIEGEQASTHEATMDNFDKIMQVNVKGVWMCMKYEIEQMLKQGEGGAIVNTSSVAGLVGFPGLAHYTASKHAVIGLTRTAALDYGDKGIRINAVCPGVIDTPMVDRAFGQDKEALGDQKPIGRLGQPEEIASAVFYLCSEEASFVHGHPLVIDGGYVVG
jgi:NAD(P)-dependent dehydrogenase (short-subunit alcohol dehydrogenase family)